MYRLVVPCDDDASLLPCLCIFTGRGTFRDAACRTGTGALLQERVVRAGNRERPLTVRWLKRLSVTSAFALSHLSCLALAGFVGNCCGVLKPSFRQFSDVTTS